MIQDLKRSKRWSILPAFTIEGYIAYKIHHGSITTEILNAFVKSKVLPYCVGGTGHLSILVMNFNASSHHSKELVAMCYEADVLLLYIPPYSPEFNSIETSFSILKHWIRQYGNLISFYTEKSGEFAQFLRDAIGKLANDIEHNSGNLF